MKFSRKNLPKSQIVLVIQLTPEEFDKKKPEALEALAKDVRIQGFRPGHVPLAVAETHVDETTILAETARLAIAEVYLHIVQQENLQVIGDPEVQVLKLARGNPLEFRIQVALLPDIQLPDYKNIAGKIARNNVIVQEKEIDDALQWLYESRKTKDGITPEATNEFAQGLGNFADLASLRQSVKEGLCHEREIQEKERLRQEIVEKIAEQSVFEIPDVLVAREKQVLLSQVKEGAENMMHIPFKEYLQKINKTERELLDSFAREAERRVKRFLVVREVAKKEGIGPSKEEIEQETDNFLEHYARAQNVRTMARQAKKEVDLVRLKEYTEGVLRHEKTLQFLEQFASL